MLVARESNAFLQEHTHIFDLFASVYAHVAQMVEHSLGKGKVSGSSPVVGSVYIAYRIFCA
jgi:hypothetical protein